MIAVVVKMIKIVTIDMSLFTRTTLCGYSSAVCAIIWPCDCPCVCQKSVFCRNEWTDRAAFCRATPC